MPLTCDEPVGMDTIMTPDRITVTSGNKDHLAPDSEKPYKSKPTEDTKPVVTLDLPVEEIAESGLAEIKLPEEPNVEKVEIFIDDEETPVAVLEPKVLYVF